MTQADGYENSTAQALQDSRTSAEVGVAWTQQQQQSNEQSQSSQEPRSEMQKRTMTAKGLQSNTAFATTKWDDVGPVGSYAEALKQIRGRDSSQHSEQRLNLGRGEG